ncbi:hypothetical protein [Pseudoalteromonas sp. SR43-2]|uniref:hypothetical protein n=1 Tax=Pseudoalteromonas sp. SR43-2 TaxID=2760944 RepID=UPI0015F7B298|nr:hypothetical protein [Pseudoalteromonas sp. SR43-2]MBB1380341.1 hypothetical protein [Pseudoalteromonas sp. SR43-2]
MDRKYLFGVLIALSVAENYPMIKAGSLALLLFCMLYDALESKITISTSEFFKLLFMFSIFISASLLSVGCIVKNIDTIFGLFVKSSIIGIAFLLSSRELLSKSLLVALKIHIVIFIIHFVFLAFGFGHIFDLLVGLETQTNFSESSFVSFRATGLFDEPSLFGMTILALWISAYILSGNLNTKIYQIAFFSFSVPVMIVTLASSYLTGVYKGIIFKLGIITFVFFSAFFIYKLAADREMNVKESPIGLRYTHYQLLYDSPNFYTGSGFCSAYGVFPLDLGRDSLRDNFMSNFKDAGQIAYSVDRVGIIFFLLYLAVIYRFVGLKNFLLIFIFFSLSKIPIIGVASIILLSSCAKRRIET